MDIIVCRRLCNRVTRVFVAAHHVYDSPIISSVFTSRVAISRTLMALLLVSAMQMCLPDIVRPSGSLITAFMDLRR